MEEDVYYIQLIGKIEAYWPQDLLPLPNFDVLRKVWIAPSTLVTNLEEEVVSYETTLLFEDAIRIDLAFANGISLIIGDPDLYTPIGISMTLTNYLTPESAEYDFALGPLPIALLVRNGLLIPAEKHVNGNEVSFTEILDEAFVVEVSGVTLSGDLNGNLDLSFGTSVSLPPAFIGNTGIVIEAGSISFFLSENAALPPEVDSGFKGVYLDSVHVYLPENISPILPDGILVNQATIGNGGFSGSVLLDWEVERNITEYDESEAKTFLGFGFTLQKINIVFNQNTLTQSSITGFLKVPFFDEAIKVGVGLTTTVILR